MTGVNNNIPSSLGIEINSFFQSPKTMNFVELGPFIENATKWASFANLDPWILIFSKNCFNRFNLSEKVHVIEVGFSASQRSDLETANSRAPLFLLTGLHRWLNRWFNRWFNRWLK